MRAQQLAESSDADICEWVSNVQPGSAAEMMARVEFLRRQTELQREATQAAKATAEYTQASACYMGWSVIVLALSSLATAFFLAWDHWFHHL
jgi:hypothetical protein